MPHSYSTEELSASLNRLGLPFSVFFARALVALLTGRKISLHYIAHLMPGEHDLEANRQQLQRCLDHETLTQQAWSLAIAALLPRAKWVLAVDRTECLHILVKWKRGKTTVNLLVLAVVVHNCAVPLLWSVMPNCGASDTKERIDLLTRFVGMFGKERMRFLTADQEFISEAWIEWLLKEEIPFRIRIKGCEYLTHSDGQEQKAQDWFAKRACACKPKKMELWGLKVYVGGKYLYTNQKTQKDEYLVVISNQVGNLLEDYRLRWKIETLFQALKVRGFDLESCRLSQEKRLSGWFGFLTLGLCWCLNVGQSVDEEKPLPPKKHGRRAISVFPRGFRHLQSLIACLSGRPNERQFQQAMQHLCPQK